MLVQPMASLTDLALGLITLSLVPRLPRDVEGATYWRAAFVWAAVTAVIGAAFHGYLIALPRAGEITWAVMSIMVVVVMSYLLAATVVQVLGRARTIVFWPLRLLGFVAYAVIAATGHPSIIAIMWCESLTMACVIGLWIRACVRRHPAGGAMLVAIGVSIAAALFRLVTDAAALVRLDPDSAYHIGQIIGMVLLYRAVLRSRPPVSAGEYRRPGTTRRPGPGSAPAGHPGSCTGAGP